MRRQLQYVLDYAELRADRQAEILSQIPQLMTYWAAVAGLHPDRHRRTLELLGAANRLAIAVEMRVKHAVALARPVELSPQVQPMIQTPGHSSFPSGHSTEAHCMARVLMALRAVDDADALGTMLLRQAARLAMNRTVAGVHYPIDSRAGQVLGTGLAEYLVARCTASAATVRGREFDAEPYLMSEFIGVANDPVHQDATGLTMGASCSVAVSPLLGWLWQQAVAEWR